MLGFGLSIEPQLWALLFTMVRVGAAFVAAPVFGAVSVPMNVRILLTAAVGILSMNAVPIDAPGEVFALATFLAVAAEVLVGLALGFILQIAFAAPLVASEVIGVSMGLSFATAVNPQTGQSTPALGQFLTILLTLLFLAVDGHLVLVELVVRSYELLPPGQAWLTPGKLQNIALFGGYAFLAGLLLALPVGFLLLCLNIVVGMLSRSAPALNLFAIGIPASLAMGVLALLVGMPAMGDYMLVIVREALDAAQTLVLG
ncbi:flagellar biosynthetic protein FliR [Sphingomonas koreensis]|jgi:flagellar biosynthetic protein FliR|uniref:Flagellar biosynthetic protein FliR n=1 Tax=Sphingomonas koreensis TaxID=93064 RepID=A0A1L6J6M8_9SPHN|nr:flagellar biosynthetic protein FliR [Sphingomonas koreensis]APR51548.1 flagellar biosynthetic protein FliR [Sphingomonas koreensis]MDC7812742.1 flagellar biosynthetic protein FliR [Sphingomonas koreensis]PJI88769.1 flagellar biosynthetic protein FliR [Sphingomonas koreensis]RSU19405.1 flagellar biosynthetic protein FliR [Sphingomonas koreensis]RSU22564.1 flagellar biosynthetic protein FliR [Sphingomonas koreensis]